MWETRSPGFWLRKQHAGDKGQKAKGGLMMFLESGQRNDSTGVILCIFWGTHASWGISGGRWGWQWVPSSWHFPTKWARADEEKTISSSRRAL